MNTATIPVIADIFAIITSIIAICISLYTFYHHYDFERKNETVKKISEIITGIPVLLDTEEKKYTFLNKLEFFAAAVNSGIYDIYIVNTMSGAMLIKLHKDMESYIQMRRNKSENLATDVQAYVQLEKMVQDLKKIRKYDC